MTFLHYSLLIIPSLQFHLPPFNQFRYHHRVFLQLSLYNGLGPDGAGGAGMQAFAAACTGSGFSPGGIKVGNNPYLVSAVHHIPVMGAFHFITYPYTTGAHDTAVMIHYIPGMGSVHLTLRKQVRVADIVHPDLVPEVLQFTFSVGYTDGADVVAFGIKEFGRDTLVFFQFFRIGPDHHIGGHFRGAGRDQFIHAFDFHETKPAGPDIHDALQMTHGQDLYLVFPAYFQDGFMRINFEFLFVYYDGYLIHIIGIGS